MGVWEVRARSRICCRNNGVATRVAGRHCVARISCLRRGSSGRTLFDPKTNSWLCQSGPAQVRIQARLAGVKRARLPKRGTTRGATNGLHFRLRGFHLSSFGLSQQKLWSIRTNTPNAKRGRASLLPGHWAFRFLTSSPVRFSRAGWLAAKARHL